MKSIEISVQITPIDMGFLRATSPELPGLYSASKRLDDLLADVRLGIADLLTTSDASYAVGEPKKVAAEKYVFRADQIDTNFRRAC